jgi:hypothetical protein
VFWTLTRLCDKSPDANAGFEVATMFKEEPTQDEVDKAILMAVNAKMNFATPNVSMAHVAKYKPGFIKE